MSIVASRWALYVPGIGATARLVLLALADHADHETRTCNPAVNRLASITGFDARTIRIALRELEKRGLVSRFEHPGCSNLYELHMPEEKGAKNLSGRPESDARGRTGEKANLPPTTARISATPESDSSKPRLSLLLPSVSLLKPTTPPSAAHTNNSPASYNVVATARHTLFRQGLTTVCEMTGRPPQRVRSILGKLLKLLDDDASQANLLIRDCAELNPAEPVSWLIAAAQVRGSKRTHRGSDIIRELNLPSLLDPETQKVLDELFR